jgi:NAD(P) transhydrogenase subunit alpha
MSQVAQRVGVVRESHPGEKRVAATPATVRQLLGLGYEVVVEAGAGLRASLSDEEYAEAGARVGDRAEAWGADVVLAVNAPAPEEIGLLTEGAVLVGLLAPATSPELLDALAARSVTALAMEAVPRISRAQSMDVLSSMANIAGYRAVVEAAHLFGRFFTGQVTAAGKVPPATVLVAGAGVAGLAAIGAAGSLGAVVKATDPRPEVADQVRSLGGEYLAVEAADAEAQVSTTGYAKEMSDDYNARAAALYARQVPAVDVVITTALIPGKPAPRLLTEEMVASMRPGSVIVDMAAGQGGNVAGSVPGEVVVTPNQVTIVGYTDLPSRLPTQASQLYGTNLVNLLKLLTPAKDGHLTLDWDDPVQRSVTVTRDGAVSWPPPPVAVSAAPAPAAAGPAATAAAKAPAKATGGPMTASRRYTLAGAACALLFVLAAFAPAQLTGNLTVFTLAVVIGYYVIGHVHHALHTPLMSVTNAISGIIVVGALLQIGHGNTAISVLSFVAILLASVNIFGGFAVTRRMLNMFSKD